MKNEVFERDYAEERRQRVKLKQNSTTAMDIIGHAASSGLFKKYGEAMNALPKYIVPEDKKAYEDLLSRLDNLARRMGGKIKGVVDYEKWESYIIVILPFFECASKSDITLLKDIAEKSNSMSIQATEDGNIRIYIMINYFAEIGDTDAILEDVIMEDDKLVALLEQQRSEDKEILLGNPVFGSWLKENAAKMDMAPEDLYDMIEDVVATDPEGMIKSALEQLQSEDEDAQEEE